MIKPGTKRILTVGKEVGQTSDGIRKYEVYTNRNSYNASEVYVLGEPFIGRIEGVPSDRTLERWCCWIEYVCRSGKVAVDGYDVSSLYAWLRHMQSWGNQ